MKVGYPSLIAALLLALLLAASAQAHPRTKFASKQGWPTPPAWFIASPTLACIEMRESTDGRGSTDLYGFLQSTWAAYGGQDNVYQASPAEQLWRAWLLYSADGFHQPWGQFDGCA